MSLKKRLQAAAARVHRINATAVSGQIDQLESFVSEELVTAIRSLNANDHLQLKSVRTLNSTATPLVAVRFSAPGEEGALDEDGLAGLGQFVAQARRSVPGFWCTFAPEGDEFLLEIGSEK